MSEYTKIQIYDVIIRYIYPCSASLPSKRASSPSNSLSIQKEQQGCPRNWFPQWNRTRNCTLSRSQRIQRRPQWLCL